MLMNNKPNLNSNGYGESPGTKIRAQLNGLQELEKHVDFICLNQFQLFHYPSG